MHVFSLLTQLFLFFFSSTVLQYGFLMVRDFSLVIVSPNFSRTNNWSKHFKVLLSDITVRQL